MSLRGNAFPQAFVFLRGERGMDRSRLKEEDEKLRESRLSGEAVFEGRLLHVYRDRVKLPDGRESTREYLRHPGAAAVVLLKEGKILLDRQWR